MKTIIVDDEFWMLKRFESDSSQIEEIELIGSFSDPTEALAFAENTDNHVEMAFLDVEMPGMDGMTLASKLREIVPGLIIFYLSAHEQYMSDAFRSRIADYYILKPYTIDDLQAAANRAKLLCVRQKKRIYIETFGLFNVYVDGKFLLFTSRIAKEIMALLVHKRGTALSNKEAYYTIWEDAPYTHEKAAGYRKSLRKLHDTLEKAGIADIMISSGKEHRLDITKVDCDYYDFLNENTDAIQKFSGEYMSDYSWGEETAAYLSSVKQRKQGKKG